MIQKLKQIILYDGLETKEDYQSIVGDIKEQNRKNISFYSLLVAIALMGLFLCADHVESLQDIKYTYLLSAAVLFLIFIGMRFGGRTMWVNTLFTYMFSTMMLGFGLVVGTINETDEPAIAFCVLIVILPFITYDVAIRSLTYRIIMAIIFVIMAFKNKDAAVVWTDLVDVICYGSIGAIVGVLNQKIKTNSYFLSRNMNREIEIKTAQIENITIETISAMSDTLEAKDEYTRGHSNRVSEYSELIAKEMGLPEKAVSEIAYAATLHDIGKIGVPDSILNKPTRLTDEEYETIQTHSTIGSDILRNINMISYTSDIARHHHERYDGKGYPDHLKGHEISIGARIVAVADAFDAMNSKRVYRKPLDRSIILEELRKNKGIQFDPDVVDVFLGLLESGAVDEVTAEWEQKKPENNGMKTV